VTSSIHHNFAASPVKAGTAARADDSPSPFTIEYIMVLCDDLRHMAYLDPAGQWREAYSHRELPAPVRVLW
jgi:hypothetical protein